MVSIFFWATLFYIFRSYGFVDIHCFQNALVISLETITTVGYTVSDISFRIGKELVELSIEDKPLAFCLLFGEMMQSVFMNSFCIGVVYARLSRALVCVLLCIIFTAFIFAVMITNRQELDPLFSVRKLSFVR